ncbi:DUF4113 domain-containing protein [Terriglobus roseus]|uniref:DUF4113 domain-containing protein n=1 Tax=Terriglobus roseus TaxID=392734 RepID=UPI0009D96C39
MPVTSWQPMRETLDREKRERAWRATDWFNATLGLNTIRILGAVSKEAAWKLRAEHRLPRWTTRWDELSKSPCQMSHSRRNS